MTKDPVEAYRKLLDLPSDWQPDWSNEKWNWFKIGWDTHWIENHSQPAPNRDAKHSTCLDCGVAIRDSSTRCITCHNRLITATHNTTELARSGGYARCKNRGFRSWVDLSHEEQLAIRKRYEDGEPTIEIARMFGVSSETIRNWVRYAGGTIRSAGTIPQIRRTRKDWDITRLVMEPIVGEVTGPQSRS